MDGHYNYNNLNGFIQSALATNGHRRTGIALTFANQYYRVKVSLENNYRFDVRTGEFSTLNWF